MRSGMNQPIQIFTIGHSTHTADRFVSLLQAHEIRQLVDVRTIPRSRRHPQFNANTLDTFLASHGIAYRHAPELGGLRKPRSNSLNTAWRHPGFRGYADHMETEEFRRGVDNLLEFAGRSRTVLMCAEAVWWQCHRQLLADALLARGVPVCHILPGGEAKPHRMSEFAKLTGEGLRYPGLL
jgi:uncharacterized protein (DUF488 family)